MKRRIIKAPMRGNLDDIIEYEINDGYRYYINHHDCYVLSHWQKWKQECALVDKCFDKNWQPFIYFDAWIQVGKYNNACDMMGDVRAKVYIDCDKVSDKYFFKSYRK